MLYDLVACPHRVTMDAFGDAADRDDISPFVQLLWDRGQAHEQAVMADLGVPFLDLSGYAEDEKEARTLAAMERGEPLIYSGRISADDLLGIPDLLCKEPGGYVAGDIKSGAGEEGASDEEEGKPKKSYAVQLALYTDVLQRLGKSAAQRARDRSPKNILAAKRPEFLSLNKCDAELRLGTGGCGDYLAIRVFRLLDMHRRILSHFETVCMTAMLASGLFGE